MREGKKWCSVGVVTLLSIRVEVHLALLAKGCVFHQHSRDLGCTEGFSQIDASRQLLAEA